MNISVIIPVYNAEMYVRKAVESALQFEEVKEVILIEDGSPDNALEVCRQLVKEDVRVKLFQHPNGENKGAGASRNVGIENATCEYIAFLDADDYYLPNRFDKDKEIFANTPDAEGVYNAMGFYNYKFNKVVTKRLTTITQKVPPEKLFFQQMGILHSKGYFTICTLTVKREVFKKTGLFNHNLILHQDTDWITKLVLTSRLYSGNITKATAMRGVHDKNRSINNPKRYQTNLLLLNSLKKWMDDNNIDWKYKRLTEASLTLFEALNNPLFQNKVKVLKITFLTPEMLKNIHYFYDLTDLLFGRHSLLSKFIKKASWKLSFYKYYK
jgi:glycosyltransferase involved in cell wall biosynthesis